MVSSNILLIVGLVAIVGLTTPVYSYHFCYICTSANANDHCFDPFNVKGIETKACSEMSNSSSTGCMKGVITSKGVKSYVRDCYYGDISEPKNNENMISKIKQIFSGDENEVYTFCDNHLCNGSNEVTTTMSIAAFLGILLVRNLF